MCDKKMSPCFFCGSGLSENRELLKAKFVVKILFGLGDDFEKHLTPRQVNTWWSTCTQCDILIDDSFAIYKQLVEISNKFRENQKRFVDTLKNTSRTDEEDGGLVVHECRTALNDRKWETVGYVVPDVFSLLKCNDEETDVKEEVKIEAPEVAEEEEPEDDAFSISSETLDEENNEQIEEGEKVNEEKMEEERSSKTPSTDSKLTNTSSKHRKRSVAQFLPDLELNPSTNKYHCPSCPFASGQKQSVRQHFKLGRHKTHFNPYNKRRHSEIRVGKIPTILPDLQKNPSTNKYHCPDCDLSSVWIHSIRQHYKQGSHRQPKGIPRNEEQVRKKPGRKRTKPEKVKRFKRPNILPGLELDPSTNKYHCPSCDFTGRLKTHVRIHYRRIHLKSLSYTCSWPNCERVFFNKDNFQSHMDKHKGTPRYMCDHCPLTFYHHNPLVRHTQTEHEGGRTGLHFICEQCGKGCPNRDALYFHRGTHKNARKGVEGTPPAKDYLREDVVCDLCGKTLKRWSLKAHMKAHKGLPMSNKWICSECQKSFASKNNLDAHLYAKHKIGEKAKRPAAKWQCDVSGCRERFLREEKYTAHMEEIHGPDKMKPGNLECRFCGKRFFLEAKHKHHEMVHENAESKPFACQVCGKGFPTQHHLRYHQKYTHKMELESKQGCRPFTLGSDANQV